MGESGSLGVLVQYLASDKYSMPKVLRLPQVIASSFKSGSSHPDKATSLLQLDLDLRGKEVGS